jgi:hypothetical protein
MDLPIGKAQAAKEWIDKLGTNTSSLHIYKVNLEAFIGVSYTHLRSHETKLQSVCRDVRD